MVARARLSTIRTLFALPMVLALALANIGCSPSSDRARADGSTLTILVSGGWDERILSSWGDSPNYLVFLGLAREDETGEQQPRLAERWEHSPDYRTWTYHLRRDVRWHDGIPTTAHDVKFTLELMAHPDVLRGTDFIVNIESDHSPGRLHAHHQLRDSDGRRERLYRPLSEAPAGGSRSQGVFSWDFWTHPVGNGPYRYVRHVPKTMMEFEANPDFYKGKPKIERLVLKFGPDTQLQELLSGNVDAVHHFATTQIPGLGEDPRFRLYYSERNDNWSMESFGTSGTRCFVIRSCAAP